MTCTIPNTNKQQLILLLSQLDRLIAPQLPCDWVVHMTADVGTSALSSSVPQNDMLCLIAEVRAGSGLLRTRVKSLAALVRCRHQADLLRCGLVLSAKLLTEHGPSMFHLSYGRTRDEPCVVKFGTCGDGIVVISVTARLWCLCLGCH